jgi:diketogulonate reductase-like aldo/keto reductase
MPLPAALPLPGGGSLPSVGLGTFKAQGADVGAAVRWALQQGYRHIDTASIYRNEAEVGAALAASGVPREALYLTSKVSPYQQGSAKAAQACEDSLRQLGTPYLDLMLIHWPGAAKQDAASPANAALRRDTWRVLEAGQREGRLRDIGVSNYEVRHLEELLEYAEIPPGGCCCRRGHLRSLPCCPPGQAPALVAGG